MPWTGFVRCLALSMAHQVQDIYDMLEEILYLLCMPRDISGLHSLSTVAACYSMVN